MAQFRGVANIWYFMCRVMAINRSKAIAAIEVILTSELALPMVWAIIQAGLWLSTNMVTSQVANRPLHTPTITPDMHIFDINIPTREESRTWYNSNSMILKVEIKGEVCSLVNRWPLLVLNSELRSDATTTDFSEIRTHDSLSAHLLMSGDLRAPFTYSIYLSQKTIQHLLICLNSD